VDPLIIAAVTAYFNSLLHNQVPTIFGLSQAVQAALGNSLTNLTASGMVTTPAGGSLTDTPAPSKIYRAAANITVTVTP
jgi:hypothetical protein